MALGSSIAGFFGLIYIQDRSSMLPALALAPAKGDRVLDMCASPGGKTGLLAELVGDSGLVLANEPSRDRLFTLRQNLQQMNLPQATTSCYAAEHLPFPDASWPRILLDPPCSGWGTAAKHPQTLRLWQGDKINPLITLQRRLLTEATRLLQPGGRMVYSTCTTNIRENEAQVVWATRNLGLTIEPLPPFPGFVFAPALLADASGILRIDGDKSEAQGFFIAALRKPGQADAPPVSEDTTHTPQYPGQDLDPALLFDQGLCLDRLPPGQTRSFNESVYFLPRPACSHFPAALHWQGLPLGRLTKSGFRVHPRARLLLPEAGDQGVTLTDASLIEALLRGQSMAWVGQGARAPLYYSSLGLGWLRVKGQRLLWSER